MNESADVVVCGAGIAGTAVAYHLAARHGVKRVIVVDEREPLTLTSDKGTQGYRNWWPGPDNTMLRLVSRSIDIMEEIARESGNVIRMSRRGYLFATALERRIAEMRQTATQVSGFGMGELREHTSTSSYQAHLAEGFASSPAGADLLLGDSAREVFPELSSSVCGALHVRRAGFLSAVALGSWSLARAAAAGAVYQRDRVTGISTSGGRVSEVTLASGMRIATERVIVAAGPMLRDFTSMLGVDVPLVHELHAKLTFRDTAAVIPRSSPFLIWTDGMRLDWTDEERESIRASDGESCLLHEMPGGVHVRPVDGTYGDELQLIWTYENDPCTPAWPPAYGRHYAAAVMRGIAAMIPAMARYRDDANLAIVDGGFYCKTPENRPLIGPLGVPGAFVCGALSGSGVMMAHGAAELVAAHVMGTSLPDYERWFRPSRYEDAEYTATMRGWGAGTGQL